MPFIVSTMSAGNNYTTYKKGPNDLPIMDREILVKGGTGIIGTDSKVIPQSSATEVTADELTVLKSNPEFNAHLERGFLVVTDKIDNPDKVAADMTATDNGRQLTDADYKNQESKPQVSTGKTKG